MRVEHNLTSQLWDLIESYHRKKADLDLKKRNFISNKLKSI